MTITRMLPAAEVVHQDNEWLPDHCPPWCPGKHAEVLAEGNSWVDSQEHHWDGYGDVLQEIRNCIDHRVVRPGGGGWNLGLRQRPLETGGYLNEATVHAEFTSREPDVGVTLDLTSGEARTLARQLVALADRLDLPDYESKR